MARVFVIEDDAGAREALVGLLSRSGHEPVVPEGFDGLAGRVRAAAPDLVLLDLTLPVQDGVSVLRELRAGEDAGRAVPVICVTSRTDELDEVNAMGLGADDYVTKPFSPAVLLAHVEALLRRLARPAPSTLSGGGLTLDVAAARLTGPAGEAELTKNELRLLALLLRNAGRVVSRQALMAELWGQDAFVDDNTLTVNVNRLRRSLAAVGADGALTTHRGLGYSL